MKDCAAFHHDRRPWMMREHEDRDMIGRIGAPPAFPVVVCPRSPYRPEHIAAENPSAQIAHSAAGEFLIDIRRASILSEHLLEGARWKKPGMQFFPADAERILQVLTGTRPIAVERYGE